MAHMKSKPTLAELTEVVQTNDKVQFVQHNVAFSTFVDDDFNVDGCEGYCSPAWILKMQQLGLSCRAKQKSQSHLVTWSIGQ